MRQQPLHHKIVIIGGGITGSATAYFLARSSQAGSICVIEPDPAYTVATTPKSAGGIRQQFSVPENIAMSQFSLDFYRHFTEHMADIPVVPDINFREQGYLFVVTKGGAETLEHNQRRQAAMGVNARLMDRKETRRGFPSIKREDIALTCYTPDDGWIDPYAALRGFRQAAEHLGTTFIQARVQSIEINASKVTSVHLDSSQIITGDYFINAAGPWVSQIAEMTGDTLPIVPMCRVQHFWKCNFEFEPLPLVKDEAGLFFRPEGDGFAGGCPSFKIQPGFIDDIYQGFFANYFEESIWPMLAALVPKFESIMLQKSWGGHYAQNLLDGNMIIGNYSSGRDNLFTACGFSGHGTMHAPAVGRALSELVLYGSYQTLDLTNLQIERVWNNKPYPETGIK